VALSRELSGDVAALCTSLACLRALFFAEEASRQHAGLGDQHGRAPLRIERPEPAVRMLNMGSASILLALAGMLPASPLALEMGTQTHIRCCCLYSIGTASRVLYSATNALRN